MCRYISWKLEEFPTFKKRKSYYKAGVVLVDNTNRFLLVKNYDGKWTFPKGGIEFMENAQTAAARELFEETGIKISQDQLKIYFKYYKHIYFICNAGDLQYDEKSIQDKAEITGIGWFCFEHLEDFEVGRPTLRILAQIYESIK